MSVFVWTKMQTESGVSLPSTLELKEAERLAGAGSFWWGVGNSLGTAVREAAGAAGGTLPVLFSLMLTQPRGVDKDPSEVYLWTAWEDAAGKVRDLPAHVLEWSRGRDGKRSHHALVCRSPLPLALGDHGPFDPLRCRTYRGRAPGASQVTALLRRDSDDDHSPGTYNWGFRATLVAPWVAKLVNPRPLTTEERRLLAGGKPGEDWGAFVARFRKVSL